MGLDFARPLVFSTKRWNGGRLPVERRRNRPQSVGKILPYCAAHAATGTFEDLLVRGFQLQMIDANGAELVDDDRCARQLGTS